YLSIVMLTGCSTPSISSSPEENGGADSIETTESIVNEKVNVPDSLAAQITQSPDSEITPEDYISWTLGCAAVLAYNNDLDPHIFGMREKNIQNTLSERSELIESWSCNNREDLIATIKRMTDAGHNEKFIELAGYLSFLSNKQLDELIAESDYEGANKIRITLELSKKWGTRGIKAWDLFRMLHLASWGYVADYLTMQEAYDLSVPVIEQLLGYFYSWDEAYENYLDGYAFWRGDNSKGSSYSYRVSIYELLKDDITLFDPTLWKDPPFVAINENEFTCIVGPIINYNYNDAWYQTIGTGYTPEFRYIKQAYRYQRIIFSPIYAGFALDENGQAKVSFDIIRTFPDGTESSIEENIIAINYFSLPGQMVMSQVFIEYEIEDIDELGTYTYTFISRDLIGDKEITNTFTIDYIDYVYTKNEFANVEEFISWLVSYQRFPMPERITDAIICASENDMLDWPVALGAFYEILVKNPYLISSAFDVIEKQNGGKLNENQILLKSLSDEYAKMFSSNESESLVSYAYVDLPEYCDNDYTYEVVLGIFMATGSYDAAKILTSVLAYKDSEDADLLAYFETSSLMLYAIISQNPLMQAYCTTMIFYDDSIDTLVKNELTTILGY
ncbi:MAG: DUF1266 domain-containing protein, partial [Lachnospiraceae bacterium]|nr:DUF1266 domain-containing protein [Lachnospiraceae bacterium]